MLVFNQVQFNKSREEPAMPRRRRSRADPVRSRRARRSDLAEPPAQAELGQPAAARGARRGAHPRRERSAGARDGDPRPRGNILLRASISTSCRATSSDSTKAYEVAQWSARVCDAIFRSPKPSVSVHEGYTTAGGFEIMINCDFSIAAEDAKIGDFHIRRALFGGAGPIYRAAADPRRAAREGAHADGQAAHRSRGVRVGARATTSRRPRSSTSASTASSRSSPTRARSRWRSRR